MYHLVHLPAPLSSSSVGWSIDAASRVQTTADHLMLSSAKSKNGIFTIGKDGIKWSSVVRTYFFPSAEFINSGNTLTPM